MPDPIGHLIVLPSTKMIKIVDGSLVKGCFVLRGASLFRLQKMHCDMGAGLSVGQGVVMILEVIAASGGDSLELMVR